MFNILRIPDDVMIKTDKSTLSRNNADVKVSFELDNTVLKAYLTATKEKPCFICLRWNYITKEPVKVLGDVFERSYANFFWSSINPERFMPWYFMVTNGKETVGCGVKVQPNSFVSFEYDANGVSAWLDVRCGAKGVNLNGRKLLMAEFVCKEYGNISSFEACEKFCGLMCTHPILPKEPVYGGNNWYYAYGKSNRENILAEAKFLSELCADEENRPFMVIDDGWSVNLTAGPWMPKADYGDMKTLADEFCEIGVKPGLWVRLLNDKSELEKHKDWRLKRRKIDECSTLDPSNPEVKEYLRGVLQRFRSWGYKLLKHDYSTYDLFGDYGVSLNGMITNDDDWAFFDTTKTSAEIVLDFYRLIREETDGMYIIGCNTISHLCAGLVEINRTGDDTSGRVWDRTRALGVNTLAFTLPQNRNFYMVDADCVGILDDNIPWKLNKQWLDLLAKSGTPLFVSCDKKSATPEIIEDIKKAFSVASRQNDKAIPLDWEYNKNPAIWSINKNEVNYDWFMDCYPAVLKGNNPPFTKVPWLY